MERDLRLTFALKEELLRDAGFVSVDVPLTESTPNLIGAPELKSMKPPRRGAAQWIGAAGLDVFEKEPEVHPNLLSLPSAALAPHIASSSVDTRSKDVPHGRRERGEALNGRRPPNLAESIARLNPLRPRLVIR